MREKFGNRKGHLIIIMKILLVGSCNGSNTSGSGISFVALVEQLHRTGMEVVAVVRKGDAQKYFQKQRIKCYTVEMHGWTCPLRYPFWRRYCIGIAKKILNIIPHFLIMKIIKAENPDIVHMNTSSMYVGAKEAKKQNKKLVWHIRELPEEGLGTRYFNKKRSLKLMNQADAIISISKSVQNKLFGMLPKPTHFMIYNGIDMSIYQKNDHEILSKSKIVFTVAGRIDPFKGQYETIVGLTDILKGDSNVELYIAGTGNNEEINRLQTYINEHDIPSNKIKFLGFVEDMPGLWSQTDIAVVASQFEAFGRVTVEAMAAGCLVLGADTGGTDELIEDGVTGIKYHQRDSASLREKAKYILSHKGKMQKIATAGRAYATQNFTAERNSEQIKVVYEELLKET